MTPLSTPTLTLKPAVFRIRSVWSLSQSISLSVLTRRISSREARIADVDRQRNQRRQCLKWPTGGEEAQLAVGDRATDWHEGLAWEWGILG